MRWPFKKGSTVSVKYEQIVRDDELFKSLCIFLIVQILHFKF